MTNHISVTSGYSQVLTSQHCPEIEDLAQSVKRVQDTLNSAYIAIVEKYDNEIYHLIEQGKKQGHFRDAITQMVGKIYESWELKGAKSRYWRMLTAHIYQQYSSRFQRKQITRIIKDGGYTEVCSDLRNELSSNRLYPKDVELINIFKFIAKGEDQLFEITPVPLDFTTGDDHNVSQDIIGDKVISRLSLGRKQWFEITYQIPPSIDQMIVRITKPTLFFNDAGELILKYAVETSTPMSEGNNILGCDLGRIKKFSASALSPSGMYSQELCPSKELERNSKKEKNLSRNKESNYRKKERIAALIRGHDTPDERLVEKYEALDAEYLSIRSKLSRIKEHSSWLTARDVVIHALEQDCSVIHMEKLSWVSQSDRQGKWDFSQTQERIGHKANKFGITTELVNAAYTSWEFPESYDENPAPLAKYDSRKRKLVNVNGDCVDKDYAASIAIAARHPLSKCRGKKNSGKSRKRAVQPERCRDKNAPTPKRARKKVIRGFLDKEREVIKELMGQNVDVGGFLLSLSRSVVASGGVACAQRRQPSFNEGHGASGVSACVT